MRFWFVRRGGLLLISALVLFARPAYAQLIEGDPLANDPGDRRAGSGKNMPRLGDFSRLRGQIVAKPARIKPGETVTFTYSVRNADKAAQSFVFTSGKRFDISATEIKTGKVVWLASRGMMYTMMISSVSFAPGQTQTFTAAWTVPASTPPGAYRVRAVLSPGGKADARAAASPATAEAAITVTAK